MENIIMLLLGVILCLFGNKLRNVMTVIIWFIIGYSISNYLLLPIIDNGTILTIINILIGIMTGGAGIKLEKISVFIAVAYMTYTLLPEYINFDNETTNMIVKIVLSLLAGTLSLFIIKIIFILATSIYGGSLLESTIPLYVPIIGKYINVIVIFIVIASIIIQYKTSE